MEITEEIEEIDIRSALLPSPWPGKQCFDPETTKPDGECRQVKTIRDFDALRIPQGEVLHPWVLPEAFDGHLSGVELPGIVAESWCDDAYEHFTRLVGKPGNYSGAAANLVAGIGPTHWGARYPDGNDAEAWRHYARKVEAADRDRKAVFKPFFRQDPVKILVNLLRNAWRGRVRRARHPRYGHMMSAAIVRQGRPHPHIDFARWDLGAAVTGHLGIVLVINAAPWAVQRVFRYQLQAPTKDGNYDLLVPSRTEFVDVPSTTGSINIVNARYVHQLKDIDERLTVSMHVMRHADGSLSYYA